MLTLSPVHRAAAEAAAADCTPRRVVAAHVQGTISTNQAWDLLAHGVRANILLALDEAPHELAL
jgi:hypothetical protein